MNTVAICKYMLEQKDKQIQELQNRIAELEAMLESIGAGGVEQLKGTPNGSKTN